MSRAEQFLEKITYEEELSEQEFVSTVSLTDALHAVNLAKIEVLEWALAQEKNNILIKIKELKKICNIKN